MGSGLYSIITGLCLLLVAVLYIRINKGMERGEKKEIYMGIMLIGMLYLASDMCWGILYDKLLPVPISIQKIIYAIFYALSAVLSYRWFVYVEFMQNSILYTNHKLRSLCKIPMLSVVTISALSIWTGHFFYIDEAGIYCRGDWYVPQLILTYGYIVFCAIKVTIKLFAEKEFERQNTYIIMLSYFIFPVVFGALQIVNQNMPFLCIGITIATLQTYLFNVNFEQERELSSSKIHSFTRLFISSYYMDLRTGKREYLSNRDEKVESYLTGDFYKEAPENYEDAIHMYAENYVHKSDREMYCTMCSRSYMETHLDENNRFYSFNYRQLAGGEEKWYRMHVIAASDGSDGKVTHVLMAVMDVDNEVKKDIAQKQVVEEALVQAEKANKAKSTFLSSMSHDIRTPMNAIIGFTTLAQSHMSEQKLVESYLDKILSASQHLLSLINDVLDMSRIESGKLQIEEDEMSISEVVHDVENLIQPMAEEKNIQFKISVDVENNYIYCDKLRLNQVLINLLGNAVKFTPTDGEIALDIHQEMVAPEGYGVYIFKVRDNGIGIGEEFIDKLFEAFSRDKGVVNGIQGTGLGLAITKSIVEKMGGRITVESELGKGTEFTVKIVFMLQDVDEEVMVDKTMRQSEIDEEEARRKEQKALFAGKKILLVEDNTLNREIARMLLSDEGFVIEEAINGKEAVDKIKEAEPGEYAAILMDVQMPIMNGYEATKAIRNLSNRMLAKVPILAMTANAFEEEKKEAFSKGMNGYITKPIEVSALFEALKLVIK